MDYTSIFTLMRAEVTLTAILVFVFLYDLMAGERARRRFSAVVCCLMVVQVVVNLVPAAGGELFGGMFCHTPMDGIVKSMLSVGALIVFLQSDTWLRREDTRHKQGEFYILTLSTLLGMYFMIGAGNFLLFFIGCIVLRILIILLYPVPVRKSSKQRLVCRLIQITCKGILLLATAVKKEHINKANERFRHPAIIIANHQSFIDILVLLSLSSKILMVTNHWVWHSPFFGAIIRYVDFYYIGEGYEQYMERMRKKVKEGYSIAIFPEGTRTYNGKMKRFHKGAFYLAEALKLDILPILLYGNNKIIAKAQPFNIRKGIIYTEILPRIPLDDLSFGSTYQERTKRISAYMKEVYARICREQNTTDNPAFYEALIQNYIYKGPVVEWYIRIKVKMEKNYRLFNRLIPVQGQITDIGCGFGPLCYMLSLLSEDREILGIDYDEDKIALAQHGWLRNEHLQFKHGNALEYPLPESDVFILNDMLHYMSYEHQQTLLLKCAGRLRSQGMIIIRDGNSANASKHRLTRFTELLSTRIFNFNRTTGELYFTTETQLREIAVACGMAVEIIPNDKYTSNTIYIFRKPN